MGPLAAYMSLALALSAQGGTVVWWAGVQNTRMSQLEAQVDELQTSTPLTHRQLVDADRQIAVIDERIANILSRLEALTAALERLHDSQ
jgi:septal ring factor EnvC (AmiA/AmiB activator)